MEASHRALTYHIGPVDHSLDGHHHLEGTLLTEEPHVHHKNVGQAIGYHISLHCILAHSPVQVSGNKGQTAHILDPVAAHSCNSPVAAGHA